MLLSCIIYLSLSLISADLPPIYGGGYGVVDDSLYWLGGIIDSPDQPLNDQVYRLDLSGELKLNDDSVAPWIPVQMKSEVPKVAFPSVIEAGNSQLLMAGGINSEYSFYVFQPDRGSFQSESRDFPVPHHATWVRDPTNEDRSVLFGGVQGDHVFQNPKKYLANATRYSTSSKKFTPLAHPDYKIFDHAAAASPLGVMYVVGGSLTSGYMQPFDQVLTYRMKEDSWDAVNTSGTKPSPRVGHSAVVIGSQLWVSGGASSNKIDDFPNDLFKLDLNTFVWSQVEVEGFVSPGYRGCMIAYDIGSDKGVLLFSHGKRDPKSTTTSITQLLHLPTLKLIPSYRLSSPSTSTSSGLTTPAILQIIGAVVGTSLLILILGIMLVSLYRQRKRKQKTAPITLDYRASRYTEFLTKGTKKLKGSSSPINI